MIGAMLHDLGSALEAHAQINPGEPLAVDARELTRVFMALPADVAGRLLMLAAREMEARQ